MNDRPLWADLHNHNALGYGRGTLDRSYEIAKGALLDAYCFTPHGLWHDRPESDAKMKAFHERGFELVRRNWRDIVAKANEENTDGRFTAFIGFEWHSSRDGDFHVVFPGEAGHLLGPDSADELRRFCREHGALMIPHHVGYPRGWRGANWDQVSADRSPVVDVFSEHGCGMEPESHWQMLGHSMGGLERSQTLLAELSRGRVAGVVASTDNHFGHPASYGEGLTAIWADGHDRAAVFGALRDRHTYALTGDRIALNVEMSRAVMGDIVPADTPRNLQVECSGLGPVDYVEVLKNGTAVLHESPLSADARHCSPIGGPPLSARQQPLRPAEDIYTVRIEFGWDAMTAEAVTDWNIRATVTGGRILDVAPCFAGGGGPDYARTGGSGSEPCPASDAGLIDKLNRILAVSPEEVELESFTSRRNARPTSAVVLRLVGNPETQVAIDAESEREGASNSCRLSADLGELLHRDEWRCISQTFSAPKIRLGQAYHHSKTRFSLAWTDPRPGESDWYLVKVQQKNGHIAWSSPIWCR